MARSSRDSDDSTDSEEELDSPKRITQQPAAQGETMDVDSTEGKGLGPVIQSIVSLRTSLRPQLG